MLGICLIILMSSLSILCERFTQVLDFLVVLNKLVEQGHPSEIVEDALHIFNYNEQKVSSYDLCLLYIYIYIYVSMCTYNFITLYFNKP